MMWQSLPNSITFSAYFSKSQEIDSNTILARRMAHHHQFPDVHGHYLHLFPPAQQ